MTDDEREWSGPTVSRRKVMAAFGSLVGIGGAATASLDDADGGDHLEVGDMALDEATKVAGTGVWIGPPAGRNNVDPKAGRVYKAVYPDDGMVEYYGDDSSWVAQSVGSESEGVPSVNTEEINTVLDAASFAESGDGTEANPWLNAVSNAFRALPAEGGMVFLRRGRYEQDESYEITKWHHLVGVGAGPTQIDRADGLADPLFIFNLPTGERGYTFPRWEGFIIDGQSSRPGVPSYLVRVKSGGPKVRDFSMQEVWIEDAPNWGMQLRGHNIHIEHCAFEHCDGVGLQLADIEDAVVENSRILNNSLSDAGIDATPLHAAPGATQGYPVFRSNFIAGSDIGIKISGGTATTQDNTISDCNWGIEVTASSPEVKISPRSIDNITNQRINSSGTRTRYNGVIGGGPLGGVDLSTIPGLHDGDKALSDGTATGFPAHTQASWDATNTQWVRADGQATV